MFDGVMNMPLCPKCVVTCTVASGNELIKAKHSTLDAWQGSEHASLCLDLKLSTASCLKPKCL